VQIVAYETAVNGPAALVLASDAGLEFELLEPGHELEYSLGERHCAGTVDDERHISCTNSAAPYCDQHAHTWVCARCTGTCLKDEMDCYQEHAIYLAAFAPATVKVGVTKREDPTERLLEQGADRGAIIRYVEDGRIAREIEAEIASEVGDRVRVPTKIEGLGANVDEAAWHSLLDEYDPIATHEFDDELGLTDQPVHETLASGTVRGTKGRILLLDHAGSTYAVDMRDLVGYDVSEGSPDRDLQSSLGAWG
jgi:hypothetical protein